VKRSTQILLGVAAVLLVAQAIRPHRNLGTAAGPHHLSTLVPVPAEIEAVLQRSCYDCHSNATRYPWYANIQPVGWWLEQHVRDGKRHLNFSEFTTYSAKRATHKLEEVAEEVRGRHMPLNSYLWVHRDAQLNDAEVKLLADWATNTRRTLGAALSAPGK
jgi:hypothetical protein